MEWNAFLGQNSLCMISFELMLHMVVAVIGMVVKVIKKK